MSLFNERCERAGAKVYELDSFADMQGLIEGIADGFEEIFIHPDLTNPRLNGHSNGLGEFATKTPVTVIDVDTPAPNPASKCLGVSAAKLGVAETGSVVLFEQAAYETQLNTLSSTLLVLLPETEILPTLMDCAPQIKDLTEKGWVTFMTGVSCTGDIELVTVRGIQGPTELLVGIYKQGINK